VAIVGVGLMGGSLALAIRRFCPGVEVVGIDYPPVLERARWRRALDRGHPPEGLAEGVAGELGFASVREEVEAFLTSDWCRELLKYLDCDLDILALLRERTLTTESTARPKS